MPPVATQPPFGAHRRREGGKRPGLASLGTRECAPRGRCNAGRCHLVQSASTRGAARNAGTRRREGTNAPAVNRSSTSTMLHQMPPRTGGKGQGPGAGGRPALSKRYFKIPRASYTVVRCGRWVTDLLCAVAGNLTGFPREPRRRERC